MTPNAHIFDGIHVVVSGEVARFLFRYAQLGEFQTRVQGRNRRLDAELEALRVAGEAWAGSVSGTSVADGADPVGEWVSTSEAAKHLGMVPRSVVKAISENRLDATLVGSRWMIHREALEHFRSNRDEETA